MKITSGITICLAAALMCMGAASCKKDTTIQYNNMTMGNVEGATFVSDQGNIFNIVEQEGNIVEELFKAERAYILCDVLNKTAGGQDNEFDIRLNAMAKVTTKDIITLGTETDEEKLKEDPVNIEYIWFSGGYINFYISFPVKTGSQTAHMVNLVQQESSDMYIFRFTHNAFGETIENDKESEYAMAGGYISFPIGTLIQETRANVRIEWTWYKAAGIGLSQETELNKADGTYVKDGFEHMPKELREMRKAAMK